MIVFDSLAGSTVGVWGTGMEGRAVLASLPMDTRRFVVVDDPGAPAAVDTAGEFGAELLTPGEAVAAGFLDVVVRSPGISIHRPDVEAFRRNGVRVTSLFELWLPIAPVGLVVGVTGTKGKSTTSQLIASLLLSAGVSAEVAGNIGRPVSQVGAVDVAVVEVSSYQAAGLSVSPPVGVLTNLDVDHLPWHGSIEQYHRDKLTLFANEGLRRLITTSGTRAAVVADGRVDAAVISTPDGAGWSTEGLVLVRNGEAVVDLTGTPLAAPHLVSNVALACATVEEVLGRSVEADVVRSAVDGFRLPPGRLEVVPTADGITWVDDPLASNPFAAAASIRSRASVPVVLIVGGDDRGVDPEPLFAAIGEHGRVRAVVAIGTAGVRWRPPLAELVDRIGAVMVTIDDDDVARAVAEASRVAVPGDAVLFSPAAPTTPAVGNWEDRRRAFSDAVLAGSIDRPS